MSWLKYWRAQEFASGLIEPLLQHVASGQLKRVAVGDTLWIVNAGLNGQFRTLGRLVVGEVLGKTAATQRLGYSVYPAKYHALAKKGTARPAREIDLTQIAERIRFASSRNSLALVDGRVNGQQLQSLRQLSPGSASLLESFWNSAATTIDDEIAQIEQHLDELEVGDSVVMAKVRKEQARLRRLLLGSAEIATCAFCWRTLPARLLVAAHVKARSACTDAERRDYRNNVYPLCALGCDLLFERGFISVAKGTLLRVPGKVLTKDLSKHLSTLIGNEVRGYAESSERYFSWRSLQASSFGDKPET